MAVLVTGGAGYIGSHTVLKLLESGREVVIADNFSNSSPAVIGRLQTISGKKISAERTELTDRGAVAALFGRYDIDSVIHFAGLKAVGESVEKPLEYYFCNLLSTLNLLEEMRSRRIFRFVFSSSATVYGDPRAVPITEDFPLHATSPYGRTKLLIEEMLRDLFAADSRFRIAILRYFNPIGAHPSGMIGEAPSGTPNNLLPYIAQVAVGRRRQLQVFGGDYPTPDGTGVRDYIHVEDLADGHLLALGALETGGRILTCNLGTGRGYSVLEVIRAFEEASGAAIPYQITGRRPGDIAACYADPSLAKKELGFSASRSIGEMCRDGWNWQRRNPNGYE